MYKFPIYYKRSLLVICEPTVCKCTSAAITHYTTNSNIFVIRHVTFIGSGVNMAWSDLKLYNAWLPFKILQMKQSVFSEHFSQIDTACASWYDLVNRTRSNEFETTISEEIAGFPELILDDLEILFTGSYQFSQAVLNLGEMLEDGLLHLKYLK